MQTVDPITVEVIHNYLLSAAREMNRNLMRTAYNTIVYEVRDFGLGLYDRHCRLLAEAPGLAIFTRANDYALRKIVEFLGEDNLHPGDVILLNYPFWSSTHTLDVTASSSMKINWSVLPQSKSTGWTWTRKMPAIVSIPRTCTRRAYFSRARKSINVEY